MFRTQSKPLSVIIVDGSPSRKKKTKAFYHWKACIFSGMTVKIVIVEGKPVSMGWCNKGKEAWIGKWVDFALECVDCKKHKITRTPPMHERTATRKARIGTARRRSISRSRDLFEKRQGLKKH